MHINFSGFYHRQMARSMEPLVVGRVIGDVVDMFDPVAHFTVHYGTKQVANGCDIKPSLAVNKPHVRILAPRTVSSNLYTLVMVDPDAPSPSEPIYREWLHWIVVDIPEGSDASKGRELVTYMGAQPPTGIHRYVLILFKQKGEAVESRTPDARSNFSTRRFAAENGFGLPVAAVYFNSQKEVAVRKR